MRYESSAYRPVPGRWEIGVAGYIVEVRREVDGDREHILVDFEDRRS